MLKKSKKKVSEKRKQTKFDNKDIKEIFDRVLMSVALSAITQALKKGFPTSTPTFGGQPLKTGSFLFKTTHLPKHKRGKK